MSVIQMLPMKPINSIIKMNRQLLIRAAVAAGVLATGALAPLANAQSSDALIDKLIDKGILTVKEAKELRSDADKDFAKAYASRSGAPQWVNSMKLYGDIRGRYEQINVANGSAVDQNRFRFRLRPGLTVQMMDGVEAGFRLTSDEQLSNAVQGGDPISGNQTLGKNASKKYIFIDLVYGKWTPINNNGLKISGTIGKMENPFVTSDMVFDPDYTPEGGVLQASYELSPTHTLKFNGGAFVIDEVKASPQDPWMLGLQTRWDGKYVPRQGAYALESSLGLSWYGISCGQGPNMSTSALPDKNSGNTRIGGNLLYSYAPIVVDASLTYNLASMPFYKGTFPIKLGGEYMVNPAARHYMNVASNPVEDTGWWLGVQFGSAKKKGNWEISYRYEHLEGDAWFEELTDSDYGAYSYTSAGYTPGTNVKGHIVKASYSMTDAMTFTLKYWLTDQIITSGPKTGAGRLQADMMWKF